MVVFGSTQSLICLCFEGVLDLREGSVRFLGLKRLLASFCLGQSTSHGSCLLASQILRNVFRSLASLAKSSLLLLVVDSQDSGNGLSDRLDLGDLGSGSIGDLSDVQFSKFLAEFCESVKEFLLGQIS